MTTKAQIVSRQAKRDITALIDDYIGELGLEYSQKPTEPMQQKLEAIITERNRYARSISLPERSWVIPPVESLLNGSGGVVAGKSGHGIHRPS